MSTIRSSVTMYTLKYHDKNFSSTSPAVNKYHITVNINWNRPGTQSTSGSITRTAAGARLISTAPAIQGTLVITWRRNSSNTFSCASWVSNVNCLGRTTNAASGLRVCRCSAITELYSLGDFMLLRSAAFTLLAEFDSAINISGI